LYTSGTTGKPKGIVHTTAGYLLWAKLTCEWVFGHMPNTVHWCTADIGWITGHTYVAYGPLLRGATVFLYEGTFDTPSFSRAWEMIDRHKVEVFYTAPTAIRNFMKQGDEFLEHANLSSLKLLGSVGEPINPEAWRWYFEKVGQKKCPIVDTWWQTETGGIMASTIPGITHMKPGSATRPLPGIELVVLNEKGKEVQKEESGKLVIAKSWPSQLRTVLGDHGRYVSTYFQEFKSSNPEYYFTGDGAFLDADGDIWVTGRIDDVLNVSGHRIGSMEVESALVGVCGVAEAAAIGIPHNLKGEAVAVFFTLLNHDNNLHLFFKHSQKIEMESFANENKNIVTTFINTLQNSISKNIGAFAKADSFYFMNTLPKTRSGKIMRRLLRDVAQGKEMSGDTSTLEA
jgi:acetyl-CoA synthetase